MYPKLYRKVTCKIFFNMEWGDEQLGVKPPWWNFVSIPLSQVIMIHLGLSSLSCRCNSYFGPPVIRVLILSIHPLRNKLTHFPIYAPPSKQIIFLLNNFKLCKIRTFKLLCKIMSWKIHVLFYTIIRKVPILHNFKLLSKKKGVFFLIPQANNFSKLKSYQMRSSPP